MMKTIMTRWGKALDPEHVLEDYPRPGMKRDSFLCLNGFWDIAITGSSGFPEQYEGKILVPFSPEATLSGVNRILKPDQYLHYRRSFTIGKMESGERLLLHFGAVDQTCVVYLNGRKLGEHTGGYWHFSFDITETVREGDNLLQLVVQDHSDASFYARGKQSLERGGMWYTPQSGIWQTVWMEYVPEKYMEAISLNPDPESDCLEVRVRMQDGKRVPLKIEVSLKDEVILQADGMTGDTVRLEIPACQHWTPETPVLYDMKLQTEQDEVSSYFAMRKISLERDSKGIFRLFLNGRAYFHNGILDQGYYPDGLYTAPSDEAMVSDILQMKELGFNMLRKHAKIEPDRWYYHCDRLGMLVWQDMVNGGIRRKIPLQKAMPNLIPEHLGGSRDENLRVFTRDTEESRETFVQECAATIQQLYSFPSIVVWTVFNEGWGEFEGCRVTKKIRKMDPSRLIDEASGWVDQRRGDISSIHNYFLPLMVKTDVDRCIALSEFGGYSWFIQDHAQAENEFGYRKYSNSAALSSAIERLWKRDVQGNLRNGLSAIVYTEVTDVEDETNGLMTYDREILKVDKEVMCRINRELFEAFERVI